MGSRRGRRCSPGCAAAVGSERVPAPGEASRSPEAERPPGHREGSELIASLDSGGFSAIVPTDERRRARLRALRASVDDLTMSSAVLAEGLLTGHPGHDHHARQLLDLVRTSDVDDALGRAAGRLRVHARSSGADPPPSGIDALVVAHADREAALDDVMIVTSDEDDIEALAVFTDHLERLSIRST